jgi:hypothetical protein
MSYTNQMTAAQWVQLLSLYSDNLIATAENGKILSDKFTQLTYGLTDPEILALPQFASAGWTQVDLVNVKYALSSMTDIWNCINNVAVAQGPRYNYFEPFLLP